MAFLYLTSFSDFPTGYNLHQFYYIDTELDLYRITSSFHGTFATSVACQQGIFSLLDT